jgi:hypothetical protein
VTGYRQFGNLGDALGEVQDYRDEDDAFQAAMWAAFDSGLELAASASAVGLIERSRGPVRFFPRAVNYSPMGSPGALCAGEG